MRVDTVDASLAPGLAQDSSAPATTISIIQTDPEDSLDLLLAGVQKQTGPVIFLLPEHGQTFERAEDFKRLRAMQQLGMAPREISFVIPPTRAEMLGRLALQQEFPFFFLARARHRPAVPTPTVGCVHDTEHDPARSACLLTGAHDIQ